MVAPARTGGTRGAVAAAVRAAAALAALAPGQARALEPDRAISQDVHRAPGPDDDLRAPDASPWIAADGGGLSPLRRDRVLRAAEGPVSDTLTSVAEGPDDPDLVGTIGVGSAAGLGRARGGRAERYTPRRGPEPRTPSGGVHGLHDGAATDLRVEPHIYQTRWFYLLCLAAAITLGWALHRLRVRRLRAREKALETRVEERTRQIEEAAAALRASEAFASAIVGNVADGIIALRQDGTITSWNAAAATIFQYTEEEAIGRDAQLIGLDRPAADALRTRVLGDGARKDGSSVPVEVHATRAEVHGEPVSIWLVRDLTEARQAEAKVAAIQSQLIEISRRAGMAQVATSVLHSVGNSLTSLSVSASVVLTAMRQSKLGSLARGVSLLARTQPASPDDDRARHLPGFLAKVTEALQEEQAEAIIELEGMERTIEQIEAIVRSQQSRAQVGGVAESIVLNELVEDALRFQRVRCEAADVSLLVDFAELPRVRIDRARVLEILLHLLTNAREAVEHTPPSDLRHILVRTRRVDRDHVAIDVIDTGVGIPAEHLVGVFAQGFTTKRDGDGFGLHSSACLATELGGALHANSEGAGQGACFTLVLPVSERAVTAEPAAEAM